MGRLLGRSLITLVLAVILLTSVCLGQSGIQVLISELTSPDWMVRFGAADSLGKMGSAGADAVDALGRVLIEVQDGEDVNEATVREAAAKALGNIGIATENSLSALIQALDDPSPKVRQAAAKALGVIGVGSEEALSALIDAREDEDALVRCEAVVSLARIANGSSDAILALAMALGDSNWRVKKAATDAINALGEAVAPALSEALHSDDASLRQSVVGCLGNMGSKYLPELRMALQDTDPRVRRAAADALSQMGSKAGDAVPDLVKALQEDSDGYVRRSAAKILGRLGKGQHDVTQALLGALLDDDEYLRREAVKALGQLYGSSVYQLIAPALTEILRDEAADRTARTAAIRVLGELGMDSEDAVSILEQALSDGDPEVSLAAASAIQQLSPKSIPESVIAAIVAGLASSDVDIRREAVELLSQMSDMAGDAADQLSTAIQDSDVQVRNTAAKLLEGLGPAIVLEAPALIDALHNDEADIRGTAMRLLRLAGLDRLGADSVDDLIEVLGEQTSDDARLFAVEALRAMGQVASDAVQALVGRFKDTTEGPGIRIAAARAAMSIDPEMGGVLFGMTDMLAELERRNPELVPAKLIPARIGPNGPAGPVDSGVAIGKDGNGLLFGLGEISAWSGLKNMRVAPGALHLGFPDLSCEQYTTSWDLAGAEARTTVSEGGVEVADVRSFSAAPWYLIDLANRVLVAEITNRSQSPLQVKLTPESGRGQLIAMIVDTQREIPAGGVVLQLMPGDHVAVVAAVTPAGEAVKDKAVAAIHLVTLQDIEAIEARHREWWGSSSLRGAILYSEPYRELLAAYNRRLSISPDMVDSLSPNDTIYLAQIALRLYQSTQSYDPIESDAYRESALVYLRSALSRYQAGDFKSLHCLGQIAVLLKECGIIEPDIEAQLRVIAQSALGAFISSTDNADNNIRIATVAGYAGLYKHFEGDPAFDGEAIQKRFDEYLEGTITTGDLDEDASNYDSLGMSFYIDLLRTLGREDIFLGSERWRRVFERFRDIVSPTGLIPEYGDSYFKYENIYSFDRLYILEYGAKLYNDPTLLSAARSLYEKGNIAAIAVDDWYRGMPLIGLDLLAEDAEERTSVSTVMYRRTPGEKQDTVDKLILRTGLEPGDAMVMMDLYASGSHSHPEKGPSVAYYEVDGVPLFHNMGRHGTRSAITGNLLWALDGGQAFPGLWKPNEWFTMRIPVSYLIPAGEGQYGLGSDMFLRNFPESNRKVDYLAFDNLRLEGSAGTLVVDDFEKDVFWKDDLKGQSSVEIVSSQDSTEGQYSQRINWKAVKGTTATRLFANQQNFTFSTEDYQWLKLDLKYVGSKPYVHIRDIGTQVDLGDQLIGVDNVASATVDQRGHDAYGEIRYDGYISDKAKLTRRMVLTEEGYLVIQDEFTPSPDMDGYNAGQLWQMYKLYASGDDWFCSDDDGDFADPNGLMGGTVSRRMLVKFALDPETKTFVESTDFGYYCPNPKGRPATTFYTTGSERTLSAGQSATFTMVVVPSSLDVAPEELARGISFAQESDGTTRVTINDPKGRLTEVSIGASHWEAKRD